MIETTFRILFVLVVLGISTQAQNNNNPILYRKFDEVIDDETREEVSGMMDYIEGMGGFEFVENPNKVIEYTGNNFL